MTNEERRAVSRRLHAERDATDPNTVCPRRGTLRWLTGWHSQCMRRLSLCAAATEDACIVERPDGTILLIGLPAGFPRVGEGRA
jgi:hypothetical protein